MSTLSQNVQQAISDFNAIKTAIQNKGVTIPANTPTSDYAELISSIPTGDDSALIGLIQRTATSIDIPQGTTSISDYAFDYYYSLADITIPDSVRTIGQGAFQWCTSLSEIIIPNGVTDIADNAFYRCSNATSLSLPNTLNCSYVNTFANCTSLVNVTLENGFNAIGLDLSSSTAVLASTIVGWLNALADRTGQIARTLTIGTTNKNKLTAEEIAIATNKNWNLA